MTRRFAVLFIIVGAAGLAGAGCDKPPHLTTAPTFAVFSAYPNTGIEQTATSFRIAGTKFQVGATVTLDGAPANAVVLNASTISATTPLHGAGRVDLVVTNPDGEKATLPGAFTFTPPPIVVPLAVTSVSPSAGLVGDIVRIIGTGFATGATVSLDGVRALFAATVSTTEITIQLPAHATGLADVEVVNRNGERATRAAAFTYQLVTLSAGPDTVATGAPLTVSWVAPAGRTDKYDWIALVKAGSAPDTYVWWAYTDFAATGTLELTAPTAPGRYEFLYLVDGDYVIAARSGIVTVAAPQSLTRAQSITQGDNHGTTRVR